MHKEQRTCFSTCHHTSATAAGPPALPPVLRAPGALPVYSVSCLPAFPGERPLRRPSHRPPGPDPMTLQGGRGPLAGPVRLRPGDPCSRLGRTALEFRVGPQTCWGEAGDGHALSPRASPAPDTAQSLVLPSLSGLSRGLLRRHPADCSVTHVTRDAPVQGDALRPGVRRPPCPQEPPSLARAL